MRCARSGLEYRGGSLNRLFAKRRNLFRPSFHRMLRDILRFNRTALDFLQDAGDNPSLGEYLKRNRYSRQFIDHYLVPMGAAIWSARPDRFLEFPARFLIGFFNKRNYFIIRVNN